MIGSGVMAMFVFAVFAVSFIGNSGSSSVSDGVQYNSNVCPSLKRAGSDEWILMDCTENTVTNGGKDMVENCLGEGGTNAITNLTLGNQEAPAAAATALAGVYSTNGLAGATGAYNTNAASNGNWSIAYTWTCTAAEQTVNTTGLYKSGGGALFAGTSFTATTLQADDQIKVNYTIYLT